MPRLILRRLMTMAITLAIAAVVVHFVMEVLPGDPAMAMLGVSATPETLAALRKDLGLDQSTLARLASWFGGVLKGDFGLSYTYRVPVSALIAERLVVTLPLALLAQIIAITLGVSLGVLAASRPNSRVDAGVMAIAQLGVAVPSFVAGVILVLFFSVKLGWFSAGGFPGWGAGIAPALAALILPALALALPQMAILARITRSAMLEALAEDYIRTARAKGLTMGETIRHHALRNALVPVLTIIGLQFSFLITGAIVIENVFSLPGLGRLLIQGIGGHDIILVKGLVLLFVAAVIVINALVDIAYGLVDPRLRKAAA
jgi:peptide/nickel transport system permease protein